MEHKTNSFELIHTPEKNRGFVIMTERPHIPEERQWVHFFYVGHWGPNEQGEFIGSLCGNYVDDPKFKQKLIRIQGLLHMKYGDYWHGTLNVKPQASVRYSEERKFRTAMTKVRNRYNEMKAEIEKRNSLYKHDELSDLEKQLVAATEKAKKLYGQP
jgi:hypothetical protein